MRRRRSARRLFVIAALSAALPAGSGWLMSARADAPVDAGKAPASYGAPTTAKPQAAAHGPSTRPSSSPATTKSAKDQSAEEMLSQMLKAPQQTGKRPLTPLPTTMGGADKKSGGGAVAPSAPVVNVLREGTFLVDRIGRLSRTADGSAAEFVFDSDGTAMQDPPLVILPNLKLQQMEDAVTNAIKDPRFRVSGQLTEFRGRNYILLDKVVVVPDILEKF